MNVDRRIKIEKQIATKLISDAIAKGYSVSINDGDDYVVRCSRDKAKLVAALQSTDEDVLHFHLGHDEDDKTAAGKRFGWVSLIYGNDGFDVISDYLVNARMEALLEGAQALAMKLELQYGG